MGDGMENFWAGVLAGITLGFILGLVSFASSVMSPDKACRILAHQPDNTDINWSKDHCTIKQPLKVEP